MLKLKPIQKSGNFYNLSFFNSSDLGFRSKKVFLQFLVDILPLGSGSVDPHIFADPDPDPGSQTLADPMDPDPDPKHWLKCFFSYGSLSLFCYHTYYSFCLP